MLIIANRVMILRPRQNIATFFISRPMPIITRSRRTFLATLRRSRRRCCITNFAIRC
jgi:hypothetical protein